MSHYDDINNLNCLYASYYYAHAKNKVTLSAVNELRVLQLNFLFPINLPTYN